MTDKERLEEIKTWLNRGFDLTEEDIEWLIEQADRGVEYDRYLISLEDNKHYVTGLEQQNKRYREAIERALDENGWGDEGNALHKMISILAKVLEDE